MKKNKNKILMAIIAVVVLVGAVFWVVNNQSGEYSITKAYDYPIEVGSDEWNNLKTPEERKAAFSVPQTVIDDMTTKALLETVFTNPFLTDIWAYNSQGNYDQGIMIALDNIDGLLELTERENFSEELEILEKKVLKNTDSEVELLKIDLMYKIMEYTKNNHQ